MMKAQQSHASQAPISQHLTLALLESLSRDLQRARDTPGESEKELRLPSVTCARSWEVDEKTSEVQSCASSTDHCEVDDHSGLAIHKIISKEDDVSPSSDATCTPRPRRMRLSIDTDSADDGKSVPSPGTWSTAGSSIADPMSCLPSQSGSPAANEEARLVAGATIL